MIMSPYGKGHPLPTHLGDTCEWLSMLMSATRRYATALEKTTYMTDDRLSDWFSDLPIALIVWHGLKSSGMIKAVFFIDEFHFVRPFIDGRIRVWRRASDSMMIDMMADPYLNSIEYLWEVLNHRIRTNS